MHWLWRLGRLLFMEGPGPLCVVRFSRSRKRYERQGILVEEAALELLMTGLPRELAREQVRPAIDRILATWQHR
jgi:hypothetical protein